MGTLDRILFASLGFVAGIYMTHSEYGRKGPYDLIRTESEIMIRDRASGIERVVRPGPVVGTVEERVVDLLRTPPAEYGRLLKAVEDELDLQGIRRPW